MPLSCLIDSGTRFSESEVKGIISQLLLLVKDLHCPKQKKDAIVHRDLRLSNLLFNSGKVYLIDFGLARFIDPAQFPLCPDSSIEEYPREIHRLKAQKNPGVETYRLLRKEVSPRSDLFGVGVVAVDLFTSWVEDESLFDLPWEDVLTLSDPFITFLHKLLSRETGFETAQEAITYLNRI